MIRSTRRLVATLLIACIFAVPAAFAQTLGELAPPDALIVLDFEQPPQVGNELFDRIGALDWAGAGETAQTLAELFVDELDTFEFMEFFEAFESLGQARDALAEECPALPTDVDLKSLLSSGIATLSVSPASPFPVATLIGRVASDQADAAAELNAALVECFGSDQMSQDGTTIHILGQGSDLPLAVAQVGDAYVVAMTPDAVRGVIRRAGGSDEPSLADTPLWSATQKFQGTGFGLAVNIAGAAQVAQGFMGQQASSDTPEGYLQQRLVQAAQTLGGVAMRLGISSEGILTESVIAVDPEGGDQALADLLLCTTCSVSRPFLAPSGSNGVTSQHVPARAFIEYVQGWLDGLADITGEELDLRTLAQEMLGLDLDVALLDWIGSQVNVVTIESFTPTLRQLIFQQPTAVIMPVSSQEAAREGLDALSETLGPVFAQVLSNLGSGAMSGMGPMDFGQMDAPMSQITTRQETYRDITYDRLQVGPTLDLAVALVGNNLVIANPSPALRSVIDTFRGDSGPLDDEFYQRARSTAPSGAPMIAYQNVGANVAGFAELGYSISQPIAAALSAAAQEAAASQGQDEAIEETEVDVPIASTISYGDVPVSISGELTSDTTNEFGEYAVRYRLTGVPAGERVRVSVQSEDFDTYLYLLDEQANVLDSNDDAGADTNSALTVTSSGRDTLIEVTSFGGSSTGTFTLSVEQGTVEDLPSIDLSGVQPTTLQVPGTVEAELTDQDQLPDGATGTYYALEGLNEGEMVDIALTSDAFDTYLRVVNPEAGVILAENDDNPDTSRSAVSIGATGAPMWVQVTSWSEMSTGPFTLEVTVSQPAESTDGTDGTAETDSDAADGESGAQDDTADGTSEEVEVEEVEPVEPPSFTALIGLTEIVPDTISILSEHIGLSIGYAEIDDTVIYRRTLLEIDW